MSVTGNMPPQAYTRDVLIKAYDWLSSQPTYVRERATSADSLVGLYLQAKRRTQGDPSNAGFEPPTAASVEAFKADLRNLAEGLRQFDAPPAPPHISAPAATPDGPVRAPALNQPAPQPTSAGPNPSGSWTMEPQAPNAQAAAQLLDAKSRARLNEVCVGLNLSGEGEALKALIAIGFERVRDLLPRP